MEYLRKFLAGKLFAACVLLPGLASAVDTRYDFSFTTDNGISSSGWFILDDSWVSSNNWLAVTGSYSGSLNVGVNTGIPSGAFTSLSVKNIPVADASSPYGIKFTVGGITYTALDNKDTDVSLYKYSLAYNPSSGTSTDSKILSHTFASAAVPELVPEIDGGKLPQAALLVGALFLLFRSRERLSAAMPSFA